MHVERTITVPRPVDAVFDYLSDFTSTNDWDPGTVETRRTAGDGGVGTTYHNVSEFLGRKTEVTYTTVEREEGRRLHFRGHNEMFTGNDRISVSASGAGSEVGYDADFSFHGAAQVAIPLVAAYLPLLANKTMKQLGSTLDALT